jgi:hypothetical protein
LVPLKYLLPGISAVSDGIVAAEAHRTPKSAHVRHMFVVFLVMTGS